MGFDVDMHEVIKLREIIHYPLSLEQGNTLPFTATSTLSLDFLTAHKRTSEPFELALAPDP